MVIKRSFAIACIKKGIRFDDISGDDQAARRFGEGSISLEQEIKIEAIRYCPEGTRKIYERVQVEGRR